MGSEVTCLVRVATRASGRASSDGATKAKVLLETDEIVVRGAAKLRIPFASIRALEADDGVLVVRHAKGEAQFELGAQAVKWKEKIERPKGRLEKLGVAPGHRVALVGVDDAAFVRELRAAGAELVEETARAQIVFVALTSAKNLLVLAGLRRVIAPACAIWTLRSKGKGAAVTESMVMTAARNVGLVDVKVVRFSETHTAEKWVVPLSQRVNR